MSAISTFETCPNEMIIEIFQYLHPTDILYSFLNLNTRLNMIILGFCRYLNLNSLTYKQFNGIFSNILSHIGSHIRSFVVNMNWLSFIANKSHPVDLASNLLLMCPNLYVLTFENFTGEELVAFLGRTKGLVQLSKLYIKSLEDRHTNNLLRKILIANNGQLKAVTFDYDSAFLTVIRIDENISYPNIEELIINLIESDMLGDLFTCVPNVRRLHINFGAAPCVSSESLQNVSPLIYLNDFQMRSFSMVWSFDDITNILSKMPSLQKLSLSLVTNDQRIIDGHNLTKILPTSLVHLDLILYYFSESFLEIDTLLDTWPPGYISISYILDELQQYAVIHTVPCNISSIVLPTNIGEHVLLMSKHMQKVKNLKIRGESLSKNLLMNIQHFRRLQKLEIDVRRDLEAPTMVSVNESIDFYLPRLTQLKIVEPVDLFSLLKAAPHLNHLSVDFDCYNRIMNGASICPLSHKQIEYLEIFRMQNSEQMQLDSIIQQFPNLRNMTVSVKDTTVFIDSIVLQAFEMRRQEVLIHLCIKDGLLRNGYKSLQEWFIKHDCAERKDSFAYDFEHKWTHVWF